MTIKGVVTGLVRGYTRIWFQDDERATQYRGRLEAWSEFLVDPDDLNELDEEAWQELEIKAGVRAAPRQRQPRRNSRRPAAVAREEEKQNEAGEEIVNVATWESDQEDDENPDVPDDIDEDADDFEEQNLQRLTWQNQGTMITDPRAAHNGMPENIVPAFNLPNFRRENYLNWFLHWMTLQICTDIIDATNVKARSISWPADQPWKHLRVGEFLQWLGVWILMTVYPSMGTNRRSYWRGLLNFHQYMPEKRFECILRAFTLAQYKREDEHWGGPAREHYDVMRFDPFWETRKFIDAIKSRFNSAIKPGGWLTIDESMFSWLGRALKMPGWKVIKRKPHPIGLEAKTTACAVTGILIGFEFQEGREEMGYFEFVGLYNKSTSWLLRLTKPWHNAEKRTAVADAAFAQVRAAVALYKVGGLFLIGNVKGCNKYFPQADLRAECGAYVRGRLVCLTKKATMRIEDAPDLDLFATGWRATGAMVVTYIHTGGTNTTGSDRRKRKYTQLSDGNIRIENYRAKRPKVSSEYQRNMGAIDSHNFRRQSGRGTKALEKVCVTRNAKDRVFINIIGWILANIYLAKKHFEWGGLEQKSNVEVQEAVAMALIKNQCCAEDVNSEVETEMMSPLMTPGTASNTRTTMLTGAGFASGTRPSTSAGNAVLQSRPKYVETRAA